MKVRFYAMLRQKAGQKTVDFPLPKGATVRNLVEAVVTRFPEMRQELLNENGDLFGHVHVIVNGRQSPFLDQAEDTVLSFDDKVDIFPAVGGG
jgi:MoaD family protein